jgi:hypothetical protein
VIGRHASYETRPRVAVKFAVSPEFVRADLDGTPQILATQAFFASRRPFSSCNFDLDRVG